VDNVTHTLVGLIIGESVAAHTVPHERGLPIRIRRTALMTVALLGSNAPDLDLLVSFRGSSAGNLDYMLWHRGYTHTVLGCAALALLLYAATELVLRMRHLAPSREDRLLLLGTAALATALHLAMDYLNSYGVHPFWPMDNHWRYGDRVFIVEPLYWVAAAPLWWGLRRAASRLLFALAVVGAVVLGLATDMMSGFSCLALTVGFLLLAASGSRLSARSAPRLSVVLALAVTCAFAQAGREAAQRAEGLAQANFPGDRLLDHVLMPQPANPLCWDLLLLETSGDRYVARHAVLSLGPAVLAASGCALAEPVPHTAPLVAVGARDSSAVQWLGETFLPGSLLKKVVAANCEAAAFMLFARAPFIAPPDSSASPNPAGRDENIGDQSAVLGDLRFDRGRERGSFEVPLRATQNLDNTGESLACRRAAPWVAPRADLLGPPG
jgi:inner membrane protein